MKTTSPSHSDKTDSSTPGFPGNEQYTEAEPTSEFPRGITSVGAIKIPPLADTVFALSGQARDVKVNIAKIKTSLELLESNRRLQRLGLD